MRYILLFLLGCTSGCMAFTENTEMINVYNMIKSDEVAWKLTSQYTEFMFDPYRPTAQNCFDDHNMEYMEKLSEKQDDYLNYLRDVNNTQFICTRNLNIVKFKEMEKFKYRVVPELGLVWGYKKHVRCGGADLSNFVLRCIALEYIKV